GSGSPSGRHPTPSPGGRRREAGRREAAFRHPTLRRRTMAPTGVSMIAGDTGEWRIDRIAPVRGDPLPAAERLQRIEGDAPGGGARWVLHGVRSHDRYTTRAEKDRLTGASPDLGRPGMDAVLIPIRKSAAWWALAQDERRILFE